MKKDIYVCGCITVLLCCTFETNTMLNINYTLIKNNKNVNKL